MPERNDQTQQVNWFWKVTTKWYFYLIFLFLLALLSIGIFQLVFADFESFLTSTNNIPIPNDLNLKIGINVVGMKDLLGIYKPSLTNHLLTFVFWPNSSSNWLSLLSNSIVSFLLPIILIGMCGYILYKKYKENRIAKVWIVVFILMTLVYFIFIVPELMLNSAFSHIDFG